MNKLLLILPPSFLDRMLDFEIAYPNHLVLLGAVARSEGWDVEYFDMMLEEKEGYDSFSKLKEVLLGSSIQLIGISNHTVRTSVTTRVVAELCKSFREKIPIVVGGVNATFMWRELLESCNAIDFVLRGYAQPGLRALLHSIAHPGTSPVPGLAKRHHGGLSCESSQIVSADDFKWPVETELSPVRYLSWNRTYSLLTHTGCAFSCNFCTSVMPGPYENREVHRPILDIIQEMDRAIAAGFSSFFMSANIFTTKRERCLQLCRAIQGSRFAAQASWVCMTRVELVDAELLAEMCKAGCRNIAFGVETAGLDQWNALNKGRYSDDTVKKAFRLTAEAGIGTSIYLMLGSPDQTARDIELTIDLVREINPDYRVVSFFQPFPGTAYWKQQELFGISELAPLEQWNFHEAPICRTRHLSKTDLTAASVRLYLDRGGARKFDPGTDCLRARYLEASEQVEAPAAAQKALQLLSENRSVKCVLDEIGTQYGARGRLIALYWLSAGLREGSLIVAHEGPKNQFAHRI